MPEAAAEPPIQVTPMQAELTKKTNAGVQDTSFGADFDAEVEAAIAKDAGAKLPEPKPEAPAREEAPPARETKPPQPEKPKPEKPAVMDIPDVLLRKKEEAKPEAMDAEREKMIKEQTAGMSPKAADRFRAIEAKAWAAEQKAIKAEKLEKELAAAQARLATATDSSVVDSLKKQVEELDEIVNKNALTEHPRFKARYDAQIAREVAIAAKFVPKESASEVGALLSLPETPHRNARLKELADGLESPEASKFWRAVDDADRLTSERSAELANWKVNKVKLAELSEQEKMQAAQNRKAGIDKALDNVISRFTDEEKGVELFRKIEGNDEWNKVVDERLANVRKLTESDLNREEIAEMAAWAIGSQDYRKLFFTQRALVQRLQEEIASLKSGEPDLGDGGLPSGGDDEEGGSAVDTIVRMAKKAGAVQ